MSNIDPKLIPRLNNINLLPFYTEMDIEGWEFPPAFKLNDHISFFVPLIEFVGNISYLGQETLLSLYCSIRNIIRNMSDTLQHLLLYNTAPAVQGSS